MSSPVAVAIEIDSVESVESGVSGMSVEGVSFDGALSDISLSSVPESPVAHRCGAQEEHVHGEGERGPSPHVRTGPRSRQSASASPRKLSRRERALETEVQLLRYELEAERRSHTAKECQRLRLEKRNLFLALERQKTRVRELTPNSKEAEVMRRAREAKTAETIAAATAKAVAALEAEQAKALAAERAAHAEELLSVEQAAREGTYAHQVAREAWQAERSSLKAALADTEKRLASCEAAHQVERERVSQMESQLEIEQEANARLLAVNEAMMRQLQEERVANATHLADNESLERQLQLIASEHASLRHAESHSAEQIQRLMTALQWLGEQHRTCGDRIEVLRDRVAAEVGERVRVQHQLEYERRHASPSPPARVQHQLGDERRHASPSPPARVQHQLEDERRRGPTATSVASPTAPTTLRQQATPSQAAPTPPSSTLATEPPQTRSPTQIEAQTTQPVERTGPAPVDLDLYDVEFALSSSSTTYSSSAGDGGGGHPFFDMA